MNSLPSESYLHRYAEGGKRSPITTTRELWRTDGPASFYSGNP